LVPIEVNLSLPTKAKSNQALTWMRPIVLCSEHPILFWSFLLELKIIWAHNQTSQLSKTPQKWHPLSKF
jgi:hypothetical protein